jgi:hypothetical protein
MKILRNLSNRLLFEGTLKCSLGLLSRADCAANFAAGPHGSGQESQATSLTASDYNY